MKIAEIFHSLQGEGILVGVPSVFIRTSGCNLRCSWCDTPYTSWKPEGEELSLDCIMQQVSAYPARHVVVTGGEPMIAPEIVALTERLRGKHVTVETAGTIFKPVNCDLMSISPKLANSTPEGRWAAQHERLRIQPEILARLMGAYDYQLKFVIARPEDVEEARALVESARGRPGESRPDARGYGRRNAARARAVGGRAVQARRVALQPAAARRSVGEPQRRLMNARPRYTNVSAYIPGAVTRNDFGNTNAPGHGD